jgi:pimeloyl-ACP methyl ester carboxylesterase
MMRRHAGAALVILVAAALAAAGVQAAQRPVTTASRGEAVVPFRIHVPDAVLTDLRQRLARTRLPGEIAGSGWDYGTSLAYLKELIAYWRDRFDWRAAERRLNAFDQFTTTIDGLEVHFIHQRSRNPGALPLAVTHGWPGSIAEFSKIIGPLTDPAAHGGQAADAFHVVAISLPGFGFSGKPTEPGYGPERMAGILATLMARLGYTRYGLQGGDWGSSISRFAALNDASHVAGLHLNFCLAGAPPGARDPNEGVPQAELDRMRARQAFFDTERGYFLEQSTKPQTIGYGLDDSPAGLAAWIVEKFRSWSDVNGDVERSFTKDELLTNITLYWVTQTATSSARIYYENARAKPPQRRVEVPTACAVFPKEISFAPRRWVEAQHNLTRWTEMPRGGHFAAMEEPDLLVQDLREFFRTLR